MNAAALLEIAVAAERSVQALRVARERGNGIRHADSGRVCGSADEHEAGGSLARGSGKHSFGGTAARLPLETGLSTDDARSILRGQGGTGRFSRGRTNKASSAESVLKHALRQRGWSKQWRTGQLTGKQHLGLLEDIRQYGRAWLRHEAEAFFDHYGVEDGDDNRGAIRGIDRGMHRASERESSDEGILCTFSPDQGIARGIAGRAASALGRFFDRAKSFVRELVFSGYMALKGPEPLSADEVDSLDNAAKVQSQYFDKFHHEVRQNPPPEIGDLNSHSVLVLPEPMTPGQFVARAEQYGNSVWQSSVNGHRAITTRQGVMREERRILGHPKGEHCHDCPPLAAMGWQPLGTLPALGDTECGNLCLCHFEFRDAKQPAIPELPGTGGPPEKPKGPPKGRPHIQIELPPDHPPGPLSPEELDEIISKMKWSAKVVMGRQ